MYNNHLRVLEASARSKVPVLSPTKCCNNAISVPFIQYLQIPIQ